MIRQFITDDPSGLGITVIPKVISPQYLDPPTNVGSGVGAGSKPAHPYSRSTPQLNIYKQIRRNRQMVWQRNYYEHVIRGEEDLTTISSPLWNPQNQFFISPVQ